MADITMPQLGETVTEGTIIRWLKAVGDNVKQDEPLFEVSTDKVDSEVPSPAAGVLTQILVQEGETVDVGSRLAVVGDSGAAPAAPQAAAPASAPAQAAPPPPPPAPAPAAAPTPPPPPPPPAPVAVAPAPAPAPAAAAPAPAPAAPADAELNGNGSRAGVLSPVVRRLVADYGLDASQLNGTGLGGRITREDVLAYVDQHAPSAAPAAPATPSEPAPVPVSQAVTPTSAPAPAAPVVAAPVVASSPAPAARVEASPAPAPLGARDEIVPFSAIRRVTAEHMVRSKATSAHTLVAVEVDFENVERVRRANRSSFQEQEGGLHLTYLPFVSRAVVDTLRNYPHLNASVGNDALIVHKDVHLGIAVDLGLEGLMVPVIHNADGQSLRGLARTIADLANRARDRGLGVADITGGTFTITNPGPYGTYLTVPIIAQPQVAILSTDGVKRRPVVVTSTDGTESIAIHSVGVLALSFDHRAVDGAYAASFVRDVAKIIETRDWSAEL